MRRRERTTDEARQQKTLRRDFERCFALSGQPIENNLFPGAALRGSRRSALPRADLLQPLRGKKPDAIPSKPRSAADFLRGPLGTRVPCHGRPNAAAKKTKILHACRKLTLDLLHDQHGQIASAGLRQFARCGMDQQNIDSQRQFADQHLLPHRVGGSQRVVQQPGQQRVPPRAGQLVCPQRFRRRSSKSRS